MTEILSSSTPGPCIGCGRLCQYDGDRAPGVLKSRWKHDRVCNTCFPTHQHMRLKVRNLMNRAEKETASQGLVTYASTPAQLVEDVEWLLASGEIAISIARRLEFTDERELFDALRSIGRDDVVKKFKKLGAINDFR